jgi:hypothetical protein
MADDSKQQSETAPMPGAQEGKPITRGLQTGKARENYPFKDPAKRGKGRPMGSVNRYTGSYRLLKKLVIAPRSGRTANSMLLAMM